MKKPTFSLKRLIVVVATIITLFTNFIAVYLPLNGNTTKELSDKYPTFSTPASYVFSIWGVIYLGLLAYILYILMRHDNEKELINKIFPFHVLGLISNSVWIILWHYEQVASSAAVMLILLFSLIKIYTIVQKENDKDMAFNWLVRIPFSVYLAWISVATIANIAVLLYSQGITSIVFSGQVISGILIIAAGLLASYAAFKHYDKVFGLVILWAIVGIAAKFPTSLSIVGAVLISAILILGSILLAKTEVRDNR